MCLWGHSLGSGSVLRNDHDTNRDNEENEMMLNMLNMFYRVATNTAVTIQEQGE